MPKLRKLIFETPKRVKPNYSFQYNYINRKTEYKPEQLNITEFGFDALTDEDIKFCEELMHYPTGKDLILFLQESGFHSIGEGESRMVFPYGNDYVIKVAKGSVQQNEKEGQIGMNSEVRSIVPELYALDFDYKWLLCQKVTQIFSEEDQFEEKSGISFNSLEEIIRQSKQVGGLEKAICELYGSEEYSEEDEETNLTCNPEILKQYMDNDVVVGLDNLLHTYDLAMPDIFRIEHWGYNGYRVVLVDAGFDFRQRF